MNYQLFFVYFFYLSGSSYLSVMAHKKLFIFYIFKNLFFLIEFIACKPSPVEDLNKEFLILVKYLD